MRPCSRRWSLLRKQRPIYDHHRKSGRYDKQAETLRSPRKTRSRQTSFAPPLFAGSRQRISNHRLRNLSVPASAARRDGAITRGNHHGGCGATASASAGSCNRCACRRLCLDSRRLGLGGAMGMGGGALGSPSLPKRGVGAPPVCVSQRRPCIRSRRLEMNLSKPASGIW
jgi:hypothetical protein